MRKVVRFVGCVFALFFVERVPHLGIDDPQPFVERDELGLYQPILVRRQSGNVRIRPAYGRLRTARRAVSV